MMHDKPHPMAGKTVKIKSHVTHFQQPDFGGSEYRVEDWHDRVMGKSWAICDGNPACLVYAMRSAHQSPRIPSDDEVLYGKVGSYGHLVHASEIECEEMAEL